MSEVKHTPEAWKRYEGDFNSMTDAEVETAVGEAEDAVEEAEGWLEAVASWKAAGCPRKEKP